METGGIRRDDQITMESRVTWADKARKGLPVVCRPGRQDSSDVCTAPRPPSLYEEVGDGKEKLRRGGAPALLQGIPLDIWDAISSYLDFRDMEALSSTCWLLWLHLHMRDSIWSRQLQYFRRDMANLRCDGGLLCTEFVTPSSCSAYERMKLEHRLYVMDTRREWHFRDREKNDRSEGLFSSPLSFSEVADNNLGSSNSSGEGNQGRGSGEFTPLTSIRILRPVLLEFSGSAGVSVGSGSFGSSGTSPMYTPSEYMTLCDNINHSDFTGSRIGVEDLTALEDELFRFALLQTLRRAMRRPPPRNSAADSSRSHYLMLRHFGGALLAICRYEAEQILQSLLRMPGLLDDFVSYSIPGHDGSRDASGSTPFCRTRYFLAPELCHRGRVGLIVVDPLRMLVVVGKERASRDCAQWDDVHIAAVEGRAAPGGGMNPQQVRRV